MDIIPSPTTETAFVQDREKMAIARRYLNKKREESAVVGISNSSSVIFGDPAESILEFSKKKTIDLVVMTTHGKSGLKRAIIGSVADAVIRESGKPVLVVRPKTRRRD
jgi:nucleotide-binding universal stress UspA family protein